MEYQVHRPYSWVAAVLWMVLGLAFFFGLLAVAVNNFFNPARPPADTFIPGALGLLIPVGTFAGAVASVWGYFFPRTLGVEDGMIVYYVGNELVGQVPFANIRKIDVEWEQQNANPMMYGGGLVGAIAAMNASKKKPTTLIIKIHSKNDRDTFWPLDMFISKTIRLKLDWNQTNDVIANRLKSYLSDDDEDEDDDDYDDDRRDRKRPRARDDEDEDVDDEDERDRRDKKKPQAKKKDRNNPFDFG